MTERSDRSRPSANIWGWKFSWISLVIIGLGFIFLLFVGPRPVGESLENAASPYEGAAAADSNRTD